MYCPCRSLRMPKASRDRRDARQNRQGVGRCGCYVRKNHLDAAAMHLLANEEQQLSACLSWEQVSGSTTKGHSTEWSLSSQSARDQSRPDVQ